MTDPKNSCRSEASVNVLYHASEWWVGGGDVISVIWTVMWALVPDRLVLSISETGKQKIFWDSHM